MTIQSTISMDEYISELKKLISLNTVSPLTVSSLSSSEEFLQSYLPFTNKGEYWVHESESSKTCVYSHIDTKPPLPTQEWLTDPLNLEKRDGSFFGLGVSDAKFQLLNMLKLSNNFDLNYVVDGAEEIGALEVAEYILRKGFTKLIIIDGSSTRVGDCFNGLAGQLDGYIDFDSKRTPQHPSKFESTFIYEKLREFREFTEPRFARSNITRIESDVRERSLTLECFRIYFDIRFLPSEFKNSNDFIQKFGPCLKQNYMPLGKADTLDSKVALFSSALGNRLFDKVETIIVPGGLRENGNHRPNEFIYEHQILSHFRAVERALVENS